MDPAPSNWSPSIVQGKTYNTNDIIGRKLYNQVQNLLEVYKYQNSIYGKEYYKMHGKKLLILPENQDERPKEEYIRWHNENIYLG